MLSAITARAEPAPETPASAQTAPAQTAVPTPAPAPAPQGVEVVVQGHRTAPDTRSLSRAEVRQVPGAFGDPFRAIEALPGVTPIASGAPFFYVRGAPPGNVGYFLDGVRVPYLHHIGLGPSVVHPATVERVDLYAGGYPARHGRFAGGIVAAETAEPRTDFHGEANVRLFDAGAVAESGFAGDRGTVLVGGRYSYTGALVSLLSSVKLDYRDYQARVSYDLGDRDRVSVFGFGAYDVLGEVKQGVTGLYYATEFHRADLRYDRELGDTGHLRVAATLGYDQTRIAEERNGRTRLAGSRVEVQQRAGERVLVRGGADVTLESFGATSLAYDDPENPDVRRKNALFPARDDLAVGGFVDCVLDAAPGVEVTPGVRVDVFRSGTATATGVDPRLAARFAVTKDVRIVHAYGIAHQPPSFVAPLPGLVPGTLASGLQKSFQTSAGVEVDLPEAWTASATLFHNAFFDMTDAAGTSADFDVVSTDLNGRDARSLGSAAGLEILVRRPLTRRLGGFLSYTLSRSRRSLGRESFPSAFDRTHVANVAVGYDLGRAWRAGVRGVFYTGTPKAEPANGLIVPPRDPHPERGPAFYRIDLRLEKRWRLGKQGWLAFVVEVLNATLSKETFALASGADRTIGPITIPSLGLEAGY